MNKRVPLIFFICCLLVLSCGGCGGDSASNTRRNIVVAMGDSITYGVNVDNYNDTYVPRLQVMLGKEVINEGVPGAKSFDGAAAVDEMLAKYNPEYLTIYYGTNDLGFYSLDSIIDNLSYIIHQAKDNGTVPIIATMGPFLADWASRQPYAYELDRRIRELATSEGISYADLEVAMGSNPAYMVMPDGEHPNAAGHAVIAQTFYNVLR
jgi:lysophospholipase L1-like esterase